MCLDASFEEEVSGTLFFWLIMLCYKEFVLLKFGISILLLIPAATSGIYNFYESLT